MNTSDIKMILTCHQRHDIPLQHSVALFYRVLGLSLSAAAKRAGYTRGYLYMALSGERKASVPLRQAVCDDLGVDVWSCTAEMKNVVLSDNTGVACE
ncbi:MAG: helix-turn-helix transcriptional regulator [Gammaproteobacteria bacterium]|nr:helix-turn-helix transcriptional regulator [Gammaproteobacteria bacterium]